jgi:hypothetical protein
MKFWRQLQNWAEKDRHQPDVFPYMLQAQAEVQHFRILPGYAADLGTILWEVCTEATTEIAKPAVIRPGACDTHCQLKLVFIFLSGWKFFFVFFF